MPRPIAFVDEDVEYKAFPEFGAFFGTYRRSENRSYLLAIPMLTNGEPDMFGEGMLNITEVTCVEDPDTFIPTINAEFGTHFTVDDFPGR